ncbi:MAG: Gfo/Idh/MocA family oxidoreductase [Ruminococcaceae bacterium]|nr:Gfo/Idh/MocA family oxidoreductase [Oscillospiraceae bacterium]
MRKIRVAQIGTSKYSHGNEIFKTALALPEVFEVVGYALPEGEREKFPDKVKLFAKYREMTVEEILTDETIDAVLVETEEIYLTKYALMAARAGKHIHMEKPGGVSLSDFEELIETVRRSGTVFHTGYMYRYNPVIKEVIAKARAGEYGDIISVEAQMSGWRGEAQTCWLSAFPGGMMFYLGCHLVDLVLSICGKPERIIPFNKSTGVYETDARDYSFALFEYKNGVSFVKTTQAEMGGFKRRQLVVTGSRGKVEVRPLEISIKYPLQYTEYTECESTDWDDGGEHHRSPDHDRYTDMMLHFAERINGKEEKLYTLDYELELFRTITKCCE